MFTGLNFEGQIVQDRFVLSVAEADVFEDHFTGAMTGDGSGIGSFDDLERLFHQFTDSFDRG